MAMIICPYCGEQVSDKAKKCVHCNNDLMTEDKKHCTECGLELTEEMTECPNCGCPVEDNSVQIIDEIPQKVELTGVKITKRLKTIIGIILIVLIVGGLTTVAVTKYQKNKVSKEYSQNIDTIAYTMLNGASEAESCGNLIKQVWYNAIYEKRDNSTDKYTRPDGYFVDDFNDALGNLFVDSSFKTKISSIKDNQELVNVIMKKLKNPPKEYEDAYEAISKLYDAYISLTNCAIDPSGSLQTYSNTFNDADTNTLNAYKAMKLYLND